MSLITFSATMLYVAIGFYSIATIVFGFSIKGHHKQNRKTATGTVAIWLTKIGFAAQVAYFISRWIYSGHAPLGNMFEFVTFLGMSIVLGFIIIFYMYRLNVLGLFALPIDRKSTRLNSSHVAISYAVFCLKKKNRSI